MRNTLFFGGIFQVKGLFHVMLVVSSTLNWDLSALHLDINISRLFVSQPSVCFCGGDCSEDVTIHLISGLFESL